MTNGWIFLNKPEGVSSTLASTLVRRLFKASKAGHVGTLDPFASGVLPIALGEATKTIPYFDADSKSYVFQITWGEQRNTDDVEGDIIKTSIVYPSEGDIRAALPYFKGTISQIPPAYSAIKIQGKRAYALARAGENVSLSSRQVRIDDLKLLSIDSLTQATFQVDCGSGTYVRSLARDLACYLGTVGFVSYLQRIRVGKIHLEMTISLEKLKENRHILEMHQVLKPIGAVLDDIPAVTVSASDAQKVRQGKGIFLFEKHPLGKMVTIWENSDLVAIGVMKNSEFFPKRVFNI